LRRFILLAVSPADWIALVQAVFLAVAAGVGAVAAYLAKKERLEAAKEFRRRCASIRPTYCRA
jgi:hypothetical protein